MEGEQRTAKGYLRIKDTLDIKGLKNVAGGEVYAIIFLKLRILGKETDGYVELLDDFCEDLASKINEDVVNVKAAIVVLQTLGYAGIFAYDEVKSILYSKAPDDFVHADIPWDQEIISKEKPKEKKPRKKRETVPFVPPTVEEVEAYCQERGNGISGAEFVASYASKGWVVGKNRVPMKDWKSAVTTWEINRGFKYVKPKKEHKESSEDKYANYE